MGISLSGVQAFSGGNDLLQWKAGIPYKRDMIKMINAKPGADLKNFFINIRNVA